MCVSRGDQVCDGAWNGSGGRWASVLDRIGGSQGMCSCVVVYGADEGLAAGSTGGAMEGMQEPGVWLTVECIGK